jgi:hypothetical protein
MTSAEIDLEASTWARYLEAHVAYRTSVPLRIAREMVARKIGVQPGTLENLRRGRTKGIRVWIAERIRAAVVKELEAEINRLTHDLEMARASGVRVGSTEIIAAETALARAREVIEAAR